MTRLTSFVEKAEAADTHFVGTIAFRNEEISLPDGSKMALGIDDGHWVLVYQSGAGKPFQVFEYSQREGRIMVDKKVGGEKEKADFKQRLRYFFAQAEVEDLVTILPPRVVGA